MYVTTRHRRLVRNTLKYASRKEAMIASGYSPTYSHCGDILKTKGYIYAMSDFIKQLKDEQQRLIKAIAGKELDEVEYKDAVSALDKITKNTQLLSGGATERTETRPIYNGKSKDDE